MRRWALVFLLAGCSSPSMVVELDADPDLRQLAQSVEVVVSGATMDSATLAVSSDDWPLRGQITPADGPQPFLLVARLMDAEGSVLATQRVASRWVGTLQLRFTQDCADRCGSLESCIAGRCDGACLSSPSEHVRVPCGQADSGTPDAGTPDAGTPDAGPGPAPPPPLSTRCWREPAAACDWTRTDFTLEMRSGTNFDDEQRAHASFSPDACSIYFGLTTGSTEDLWRADRAGPDMAFGTPVELAGTNRADTEEESATVSPDGLELFFTSERGPSGQRRVHRATRASTDDPWGNAAAVPALDIPGNVGWEPRLAPHGLRLYYALGIEVGVPEQWVHVATRSTRGGELSAPTRVALNADELRDDFTNRPSSVYSDRVLVFVNQDMNSLSRRAVYVTRPDWNAAWSRPMLVPLNLAGEIVRDLAVSPDGCEVVFRTFEGTAGIASYAAP